MFAGVDELERWHDGGYFMREDEGQGLTDIAIAASACLGSGILVLPSYYSGLALALRSLSQQDWDVSAQTIIDRANTEALVDKSKANVSGYERLDMAMLLMLLPRAHLLTDHTSTPFATMLD